LLYLFSSKQRDMYDETFRDLVQAVLDGFNGTIFAYGQTGTGKTYTMQGTSHFFKFLELVFRSVLFRICLALICLARSRCVFCILVIYWVAIRLRDSQVFCTYVFVVQKN